MRQKMIVWMSCLLLLLGVAGCEKEGLWEISPDGNQTVIEQKINGLTFKFCLLNEKGKPAAVFKEGENFTFYFQIKNETKKKYYCDIYQCSYTNDFFSVMDSSGKRIGKSYEALPQTLEGLGHLLNHRDSYTFKVTWNHPEESIVQGGDFRYKSIKKEPLKAGSYYTSFSHKFKLFPVSGDKRIETEELHFKINFKIQ